MEHDVGNHLKADMWKVYYADETTFSSEDGSWDDAPVDGVVLVAVKEGDHTDFYTGSDYFASLDSETIFPLDSLDAVSRTYIKWIKHGVWVTNEKMEQTRQRAIEEFTG